MPEISLPLAQSKTSRWSTGLAMVEGASWSPSCSSDAIKVRQCLRAKEQSHPSERESPAPTDMPFLIVTPISGSTPQSYVKKDAPNRRFDFGNHTAAVWLEWECKRLYGCDSELEERGRAERRRTCKWLP
jgi:hypothetical protein